MHQSLVDITLNFVAYAKSAVDKTLLFDHVNDV